MQAQDSSDPTGVAEVPGTGKGHVSVARTRKANSAVQMRLAGATWAEIAEVLGYPTARQALVSVEHTLEKQLLTEDRDHLRRVAGARLDRLLRSVWPKAIDPSHPDHLLAVTKAREIVDRHAKLFGLDAPVEVIVHNPTQAELEEWVARVVAVRTPDVVEYDIIAGQVLAADEEPHAVSGG